MVVYPSLSINEKKKKEETGVSENFIAQKKERFFLDKRIILLFDEVNDETSKSVVEKLFFLDFEKPKTPILFYINSPGGSITDGMAIYDAMQTISSPVHTICIGLAASMGALLLSGGAKKNRLIFPNAEVMIHQPLLSSSMRAVSKDLEIEAEQMEKTKHNIASLLAINTEQNLQKVLRDMDRNFWLSAKEAAKYGIVDKIITHLP